MDNSELIKLTGMSEDDILLIKKILFSKATMEDAILYVSRAKGCWKNFSDIDISLIGENISHTDLIGQS